MGNAKWTTKEEETFLLANVAGYEAAQAKPKPTSRLEKLPVTRFLDDFFLRWYLKFPDYSNGKNTTSNEQNKKRIKAWYNNHTGVRAKTKTKRIRVAKITTSGKAPRDPFAVALMNGGSNRPKQKLQPKQAFAQMLVEAGTPLKSNLQAEWEIETNIKPELKDEKGAYLSFYTRRIGEMYLEATMAVKDQVEEYREEEHKKNLESSAPPPLLLAHEESLPDTEKAILKEWRIVQRCLENMAPTCEAFANTVHQLTKASILIHVVGPEPANGGALSVTQISAGTRVMDDKDIFEVYPELMARVEKDVKTFAKQTIDAESIAAMKLAYPPVVTNVAPHPYPKEPTFVLPPSFDDHSKTPDLEAEIPDGRVIPVLPSISPIDDKDTGTPPVPAHWRTHLTTPPRPTSGPARVRFRSPVPTDEEEGAEQSDGGNLPENEEATATNCLND